VSADAAARAFLAAIFEEDGAPAIDWDRYRLMQLIPGTAAAPDAQAREQLVQRGFVELGKGKFDADTEQRSLASLRALYGQLLGPRWRVVPFDNPIVAALAGGPAAHTPPNLARLLSAVADIVRGAEAFTVAAESDALGERLMTLLFVDGKYVGFLPGHLAMPGSAGARPQA
jgi:hypothetical protein